MTSVILPVYNAERTIGRAITSILSVGLKDIEIIIVDDGSSDNTASICDDYCTTSSNVKCIHKKNGGVSEARNYGLEIATGDNIMFCDADDEFIQRDCEEFLNEDLIVYSFEIISSKSSETIQFCKAIRTPSDAFETLQKQKMPGALWNKVFRRSLITRYNLKFRTDIHFREDEEFLLRYLNVCNTILFSSINHYKYYTPDLSTKYLAEDNFWCDISMFNSAISLIREGSENPYLNELTNAYFSSFDLGLPNLYDRTIAYKLSLSVSGESPSKVSHLTRAMLKMPSAISYCLFILKSHLYKIRFGKS